MVKKKGVHYEPLFGYELVLLVANTHILSGEDFVNVNSLADETLLTFPMPHERLDVFTQFLSPASVHPKTKAMESLDLIVKMVSLNRGVIVLPNWLAEEFGKELPIFTARLGKDGLHKTLFAAMRKQDMAINYMKACVVLAKV